MSLHYWLFLFLFSLALNLDILPIKITLAGLSQSLTCTVYVKNSTLFPPTNITWNGPNGQQENSDKNVSLTSLDTIMNLTIHFPVLKTSHAGPYTCQVILYNGEFSNITDYLIVKSQYAYYVEVKFHAFIYSSYSNNITVISPR